MAGFMQKAFGIGGSSSGENENQGGNPQDQNPPNNPGNNSDNMDQSANLWEDPQQNPANGDPSAQSFQQQQQQVQQNIDPQAQFADHINGLDLTKNINMDKIQSDMQTGETESLSEAFKQVAANTYKATMVQMNSLVDSKIAAAKEETTRAAADNWNADLAVREMNTKLPFTSDPNISPIATAVLNRFISKGASVEDAIKSTRDFFSTTAEKINGASTPPSSGPGSTGFNQQSSTSQNNNQNQAQSTHDSWLDTLAQ